jgi:hypothetical protein
MSVKKSHLMFSPWLTTTSGCYYGWTEAAVYLGLELSLAMLLPVSNVSVEVVLTAIYY